MFVVVTTPRDQTTNNPLRFSNYISEESSKLLIGVYSRGVVITMASHSYQGRHFRHKPISLQLESNREGAIQLTERQKQLLETRRKAKGAAILSKGPTLSIQSDQGGIQLSERQKQLLETRRKAKEAAILGKGPTLSIQSDQERVLPKNNPDRDLAKKSISIELSKNALKQEAISNVRSVDDSWAEQPTTTAPTTSWGSSSEASSESTFTNQNQAFYGQRLKGNERKLYDDTGATWRDSRSESSASSAPSSSSSHSFKQKGISKILHRKNKGNFSTTIGAIKEEELKMNMPENKQIETKLSIDDSRVEESTNEDIKAKSLPGLSRSTKTAMGRSFGTNRSKASVQSYSSSYSTDDEQKAFLRKMMQSYSRARPSSSTNVKKQTVDSESEASSKENVTSKRKLSWSNRHKFSSLRSGSSNSSSSQDRAIMKKVLERARRKKQAGSPRKTNFVKRSSGKMKKLLSPRRSKSDKSGKDERSFFDRRKRGGGSSDKSALEVKALESIVKNGQDDMDSFGVTKEDEIEIKVSASSLSQRYVENQSMPLAIASVETIEATTMHPNKIGQSETSKTLTTSADISFAKTFENKANEENSDLMDFVFAPEPEGYTEFVNTLKAEVSTSHSQLWKSFQSLFTSDYEAPESEISISCKKRSFDDKTKDTVTNMSSYLKEAYNVECYAGTQVANDKVIKQIDGVGSSTSSVASSTSFGKYMLRPTKGGVDLTDKRIQRKIAQAPSADRMTEKLEENTFEAIPGQQVRKKPDIRVIQQNRSGLSVPSTFVPSSEIVVAPSNDSVFMDHTKVVPSSEIAVAPSGDSIFMDQTKGVKALSQVNPKKPRIPPLQSSGAETSKPWSRIKLRSVMDDSSKSESSEDIPTSWTKVKLRPVERKSVSFKNGEIQKSEETKESNRMNQILVQKPSFEKEQVNKTKDDVKSFAPKKMAGNAKDSCDDVSVIDLTQKGSTDENNVIDLTQKGSTDENNVIDLTQVSSQDFASCSSVSTNSTEGSVLVSLAPEHSHDNPNGFKVLIGKRGLIKIESHPGETKARVIWRLDHEELKSAMLDMATFKVKLLLTSSEETKDLSFASSEQCMKFANLLHQMTNASDNEESETSENADDSIYVEQLSEEEQKVLEEFRQKKRRSVGSINLAKQSLTIHSELLGKKKPLSVVNAKPGPSSPVSEISGTSSTLSSAESKIAESYQKMLRLLVPKEAVRHKMEKEKVDPKIMAFVFGEESSVASSAVFGLTVKEEKVAALYRKMLKMMVPLEAVRHKMEKEGVDQKIVSAVLGEGKVTQKQVGDTSNQLSSAEQKIADKYKKMLKLMVPKEAVEHRMKKDQVDNKIIIAVVGGKPEDSRPNKGLKSKLSDEEESVASAYRQMLKLKIPKEAIRHKMQSEGISEKIVASVLGEKQSQTSSKPSGLPPPRSTKPGFHWSPIKSNVKLENSIWAKTNASDEFIDISKHIELFQKKPEGSERSNKKAKNGGNMKEMAKLIDVNRANNVAITLKAFSDFTHVELSKIIEFVDPYGKIKGDRALFMRDLLPAVAEVKAVKNYRGDDDRLVPAELWFKQIVHIKRIEEKIHVIRTMEAFKNDATALGKTFQRLTNVCSQVMKSEKLPDLLDMVRQIGNRMNEGRGEEAAGFKMDFLPRLAQTRGSDRKTTALDLVVMIFITRNQREALMLSSDISDCQEASRIQLSDLYGDVRSLGAALRKCKKELGLLKKDNAPPLPPRPRVKVLSDSKSEPVLGNPAFSKNAQSNQADLKTEVSSIDRQVFEKRSQFLNSVLNGMSTKDTTRNEEVKRECKSSVGDILKAMQKANSKEETNPISPRSSLLASKALEKEKETDCNSKKEEYNAESATRRVEKFFAEANDVFKKVENQRDDAIRACHDLSEFFCERGGEKSAANLLAILAEFATNLDRAVRKYDEQQKMELRKKHSQKKRSQKQRPVPHGNATDGTNMKQKQGGGTKSLVSMVNEMLQVAGDKVRDDFSNGVTYDNPVDKRLEKIYREEDSRANANPRRDILRAIEERRKLNGDQNAQGGLSELAQAMKKREQTELHIVSSTSFSDESSKTPVSSVASSSFLSKTSFASKTSFLSESSLGTKSPLGTKSTRNRRSIAERWTRKIGEGQKTNSEILTAGSLDTTEEDRIKLSTNRRSIAEKWSRKVANDEMIPDVTESSEEGDDSSVTDHKTDSEILAAASHDSYDRRLLEQRRQQYISRWKSDKNVVETKGRDLEEESDAGASFQFRNRNAQQYMNRWASKPSDAQGETSA